MKKITLADVATKAGVSTATVSRYLKQENVRKDIAQRIQDAINETGYIVKKSLPSQAGQAQEKAPIEKKLIKANKKTEPKKTYKFMILTKSLDNPRTTHVVQAIKDALYQQGATFQLCISDGIEALEEAYLTAAIVSNVHGIIIESCSSHVFIQKQMRTTSIPVVYLNDEAEGIHSITMDEEEAGREMGRYLINRRHLIIRYLGIDEHIAKAHVKGLKEVYHTNKQPMDILYKISTGDYVDLYEKVKELFVEKIDLLILQNDEMAIPLTKYFQEYHIRVPQHASMMSFGGHAITRVISPTMNALSYDYNVYAKDIVAALWALIESKPLVKRNALFTIQDGDSIR